MSTHKTASVPADGAYSAAIAVQRSEPLVGLLRRLADSQARLAALTPVIPEGLVGLVRPGPLDETQWTLLVPSSAAAAKLRQLQPLLEARLAESGWAARTLTIKVQSQI